MPRKAQSAVLQIMEGNRNHRTSEQLHKRVKNEKKLNFGTENLKPPKGMSAGAKKAFSAIVKTYSETSFLNNLDLYVLTRYCDILSEYTACNNRLRKNKRFNDGKLNPDLNFKLKLSSELSRMEKELGLTPAARASLAIHMDEPDEEEAPDEFDD